MKSFLSLLALASSLVAAAPQPKQLDVAGILESRQTNSLGVCSFNNATTAMAQKKTCSIIILNNINVPAGTTFDMTGLKAGTKVIFVGNTTFGYAAWVGPLVSFSGQNITITGAAGHVLDGQGYRWWDGLGGNGGVTKPKMFYAHALNNSIITGLKIVNTPVQAYSVLAGNLTLSNLTLDNSAGNYVGGAHNTDAFDIGTSDGIYITGANITNQDDCMAINSGYNIVFTNGICNGGHGLSIGSVGGRALNDVINVTVSNSIILNSENGVRIKTVYNATGSVRNVTYSNIILNNITIYGIDIQQDYLNGSPNGMPTNGVPVTGLTLSNITGSVAAGALEEYVLCGNGSCSNWNWSGINVTGGKRSTTCQNVPASAFC